MSLDQKSSVVGLAFDRLTVRRFVRAADDATLKAEHVWLIAEQRVRQAGRPSGQSVSRSLRQAGLFVCRERRVGSGENPVQVSTVSAAATTRWAM